jgi:hypothetical protein
VRPQRVLAGEAVKHLVAKLAEREVGSRGPPIINAVGCLAMDLADNC